MTHCNIFLCATLLNTFDSGSILFFFLVNGTSIVIVARESPFKPRECQKRYTEYFRGEASPREIQQTNIISSLIAQTRTYCILTSIAKNNCQFLRMNELRLHAVKI